MSNHTTEGQGQTECELQIHGMHCASCEVLIERSLKQVPGVDHVRVKFGNGRATLRGSRRPSLSELQEKLTPHGYTVTWRDDATVPRVEATSETNRRHYIEIGLIFFVVVAAYLVLRKLDLVPKNVGISEGMSYGAIFLIGLVAALSTCIAVTGGLLLAVAAKYNERNPDQTTLQRLRPHLYFNIGRVVSYTVLGGVVGAIGSVVTLSPFANGILTLVAALVMVSLGLQLLKLFPKFRRFQPRMPRFLSDRIQNLASSEHRAASFLLGAGTFFLPCGFTQALQLYVLSQGDALAGALTMLVFSLGTLPALMSLSVVSSLARGSFQRYFLKFAGVVVILVGLSSVQNGLALTGASAALARVFTSDDVAATQASAQPVPIVNGRQVVEMKVDGLTYSPAQFTVVEGVPVDWKVDGRAAAGCAAVIQAPSLGLTESLPKDRVKTISFTPDSRGTKTFSCPMGMTTPGAAFTVVAASKDTSDTTTGPVLGPQPAAAEPAQPKSVPEPAQQPAPETSSDVQRITLTAGSRGFTPSTLSVKKGTPVELTVDVQVPLSGCMSTLVMNKYDVAKLLKQGKNTIEFTPTEAGSIAVTCPMGVPMTTINAT